MNDTQKASLSEQSRNNQQTLIAALTVPGTTTVARIQYAGSGDSGSVIDSQITVGNGQPFDDQVAIGVLVDEARYADGKWHHNRVATFKTLRQALEDFAEEVLEELHGGWENNEGASGKVVFALEADGSAAVRVEHTGYFTDSDYTETVL